MFQALLTGYYLCDAAAAVTLTDYAAVARCVAAQQPVSTRFLDKEEVAALAGAPDGYGGGYGRVVRPAPPEGRIGAED